MRDFTDGEKQVLYGTLLGDSSLIYIKRSGRVRIGLSQGHKQLDYLRWKIKQLEFVFKTTEPYRCLSNGKVFYALGSRCHPFLDEVYVWMCPGRVKRMTPEVVDGLTPLGLAVWYMDDGSFGKHPKAQQAWFCTDSFTESDVRAARDILSQKWGLNMSVYRVKGSWGHKHYYRMVVLRTSLDKFFDIVRPHMHPSMLYKVR